MFQRHYYKGNYHPSALETDPVRTSRDRAPPSSPPFPVAKPRILGIEAPQGELAVDTHHGQETHSYQCRAPSPDMKSRLIRALSRAKYAAIGAAVGGAAGGLFSRNAASTGAGVGALLGAIVGEKRVDVGSMVDEKRVDVGSVVDDVKERKPSRGSDD